MVVVAEGRSRLAACTDSHRRRGFEKGLMIGLVRTRPHSASVVPGDTKVSIADRRYPPATISGLMFLH